MHYHPVAFFALIATLLSLSDLLAVMDWFFQALKQFGRCSALLREKIYKNHEWHDLG